MIPVTPIAGRTVLLNANLIEALDSASPDLEAWTFLPAPSPLAMLARRQAHETAIHRYDAESAADDRQG